MRLQPVDEMELPVAIRNRLTELRACDNLAQVTVVELTGKYAGRFAAVIVPRSDLAAGDDAWAFPSEPFAMLIQNQVQ